MNATTRNAVVTLLRADPTVRPESIQPAVDLLDGKAELPKDKQREPLDRVLTRRQVAELLQCTQRTIDNYVNMGLIRRVGIKGRALGISESSVREFMAGECMERRRRK